MDWDFFVYLITGDSKLLPIYRNANVVTKKTIIKIAQSENWPTVKPRTA